MRRVVVTGIGLVTPLGNDAETTWRALIEGKSGIGPITHFDSTEFATKFAGEVRNWDAHPWFDKRELKHTDLFLQYAVAAGLMAMDDAGIAGRKVPAGEEERWGVYVGAGLGGVQTIEATHWAMKAKGPRYGISPYFVTDIIINMAPGLLSIRVGAQGPNMSHVSACSSGAHSIGEAARAIRYGDADAMLAGGTEGTISVLGVGGFNSMRALSTRNDDPQGASRPFDKERDGFVIAEGAGVVVIEELEHAKRRGARIYAELAGYAAGGDAHHVTAPAPEGAGAQRCMRRAIADAKLNPDQVGYINAHGTSTPYNDKNETAAIKAVFGEHARKLAVSSTKSMTGHMLGAAGGAEAAITALALSRGVLPPTINYTTPDPDCDLDYVPNQARELRVEAALSNSFGFGGTNAALLLRQYRETDVRWYAGSDHAGLSLKVKLVEALRLLGDEVVDLGTHDTASTDYPDYAAEVARKVAAEPDALGVLCCGTGIGMSITANKVHGVRAAVVTDAFTAQAAREHNDANVICMGERVTGPGVAEQALRIFRDAAFAGGRHGRRVDKIKALEGA